MYAFIETGGKQYRVGTGEILTVEKLIGEKGATVEFTNVLAVGEGDVRALTDTSYVLTREQLDQRYVLACQSQPQGRVRVHLDRMKATLGANATEQPVTAAD